MSEETTTTTVRRETYPGRRFTDNPIFILGIMQRSGSNYLYELLALHPQCEAGRVIGEDFLLAPADSLVQYVDALYHGWNPDWRVEERVGSPDVLLRYLGEGLVSFLRLQLNRTAGGSKAESSPRRLVTKTPSVENLHLFFRLFPEAHLIVITRDGRSAVESGVRSFNWSYEKAIHEWADGARVIERFLGEAHSAQHKYLLVKYEDLFVRTEQEVRNILIFLGLDPRCYDFDTARHLPVKGSSELRKQGERVHWRPVEKPSDFDPLKRWRDWGRSTHERFNWVAGPHQRAFGYTIDQSPSNRFVWAMRNLILDLRWTFEKGVRRFLRRVLPRFALRGLRRASGLALVAFAKTWRYRNLKTPFQEPIHSLARGPQP